MRALSSGFHFAAAEDRSFTFDFTNSTAATAALCFNATAARGRPLVISGDTTSCAAAWVQTVARQSPARRARVQWLLSGMRALLRDPRHTLPDIPMMGCAYHSLFSPTPAVQAALTDLRHRVRPRPDSRVIGVHLRSFGLQRHTADGFARALRCAARAVEAFELPNATTVLLASNDARALTALAAGHPNVVVAPETGNAGAGPAGAAGTGAGEGGGRSGLDAAGLEWVAAVRDLHALAESDYFIPTTESSFSVLAAAVGLAECVRLKGCHLRPCARTSLCHSFVCVNLLRGRVGSGSTVADFSLRHPGVPRAQRPEHVCAARFPGFA